MTPKWPRMGPKTTVTEQKAAASKFQDGEPKEAPRQHQDGPRRPQEGPKTALKEIEKHQVEQDGTQDGFKTG